MRAWTTVHLSWILMMVQRVAIPGRMRARKTARIPVSMVVPMPQIRVDDGFPGDSFYYLRVTQTNGERAWASPVFVRWSSTQAGP